MNLSTVATPFLMLDRGRVERNISRLLKRTEEYGVPLRPHLKTAKSIDVLGMFEGKNHGIAVSTLREVDYFAGHGVSDILYAVGISPAKLPDIARRLRDGIDLKIILDHPHAAAEAVASGLKEGVRHRVLIEIDSDGSRAGVRPDDPNLLTIARVLSDSEGAELVGLMTHAGSSYRAASLSELRRTAEVERRAAVEAAERIRSAGIQVPVVSIGSTPSVTHGTSFQGITEVRAGVFVFQDLDQVELGVCGLEDIGIAVVAAVIGHRADGELVIDAGGLALSKDRGIGPRSAETGYGLVCTIEGEPLPMYVHRMSQEHGIIISSSSPIDLDDYPVGSRLRILPNHACFTASAHEAYHVIDAQGEVTEVWPKANGW